MAVAKLLIWAFLFATATLFWVIVFEHGFGQFRIGLQEEVRALGRLFPGR